MQQRTLLPIAIIFLGFLQFSVSADNVINVDGDRFQVNGKPYDMWGIRVASASQSQDLTDELIANLDDYRSWCQGPSAGQPVRYDLGGDGTSTSPGIRWYFEHVRRSIENDKPEIIGVGNRPALSADSRGNVHIVYASARQDCDWQNLPQRHGAGHQREIELLMSLLGTGEKPPRLEGEDFSIVNSEF